MPIKAWELIKAGFSVKGIRIKQYLYKKIILIECYLERSENENRNINRKWKKYRFWPYN